ncbi:hypothetical protein QZH41_002414 [Actinostola sp. cb2023]|nr:hypothetical protein QZH41_002414 [Actinostola sp. cb2023]
MAIATTVVNGLTLFAIYKDPLKCFRNPLAIFVTGVIAADFLTGLIGEPIMAAGIAHAWNTGNEIGIHVLIVGFVVGAITMTVSFLTLLALAISQLLAIGWVRRYERCVTVLKAKLGIILIWVFTVIVSVALAVFTHVIAVIVILILEVTLVTIALVILYLVSYCVFRSRVGRHGPGENKVVNKDFLKGTFLLVLVQIITVWPYVACTIVMPSLRVDNADAWVILEIVRAITNILFITKFFVDPIILVWRLPIYRKSMKIVYASCLRRCGCGKWAAMEPDGRVAYNETRREDFDDNSQENVDVESCGIWCYVANMAMLLTL